ncbi:MULTISPECIES: hypothetical protein [unclassified Bacillus (in: firmicutes)]|mgnify:CR=1 FL=1|uniref:hypothetical protein n=1 Tax=Bacillaceae TaxID=186817 RepID=UPI000E2EF730|nr:MULTISPECIES: hypothetical protein [unclassified Bacillus (in: firmicutes)]RFB09701.1 hypothetical protein DZB84_23775 [Bacillus sp. HNG]CAI9392338.1 hypothetical protein BACSP_03305 [Bacillus sp. T2.9-1]
MNSFIVIIIIVLAIIADFFWFDVDKKRWGWMKNWSNLQKVLFFSGFAVVSGLIYVGLSLGFF